MHCLLPYARIELLICTMLTRTWAPEAWPLVKHELANALKQRRQIARATWWNETRAALSSALRSVSSRLNHVSPSCVGCTNASTTGVALARSSPAWPDQEYDAELKRYDA